MCFLFQSGSKFNNIDKNKTLNVKQDLLKNPKPLFLSPIEEVKGSRKPVKRGADLSGGEKLHAFGHLETVGDQVFHGEGLLGDLTAI